jgi:hypothetical protein
MGKKMQEDDEPHEKELGNILGHERQWEGVCESFASELEEKRTLCPVAVSHAGGSHVRQAARLILREVAGHRAAGGL